MKKHRSIHSKWVKKQLQEYCFNPDDVFTAQPDLKLNRAQRRLMQKINPN